MPYVTPKFIEFSFYRVHGNVNVRVNTGAQIKKADQANVLGTPAGWFPIYPTILCSFFT